MQRGGRLLIAAEVHARPAARNGVVFQTPMRASSSYGLKG
jgi:hypothetical protein